jgi:hypothetical protein
VHALKFSRKTEGDGHDEQGRKENHQALEKL